jgi:signal transduction histidine kinase
MTTYTNQRQTRLALLDSQRRVLERIASGAPLCEILETLVRLIEEQADGMRCAVLLADTAQERLRFAAAPHIPDDYQAGIDPFLRIAPNMGSCGTAAFLRKPVYTKDTGADALWADCRDIAVRNGLRAIWSTPVISDDNAVLGTFAMYYSEPRLPSPDHIHLIDMATQMARVAIEAKRGEDASRELAQELQALSRRLVELQEVERKELGRELHDRVGQNLTALNINLGILKGLDSSLDGAEAASRLADSAALVKATVRAIENVVSELRPPMLEDFGLMAALHWYATEFSLRTGITVSVGGKEPSARIPADIEIALYRIVQEALNNVAKHAHATTVVIALGRSGSKYEMSVTDNGIGFRTVDLRAQPSRPGLGMVTMRERAQAVGGRFEVMALPESGTRLTVRVPV